jgi:enoyl-CoA hydratase
MLIITTMIEFGGTQVAPLISLEVTEGVALVTLNDPERRNAVTMQMRDEMVACFDEMESRSDVGAVVITGAGSAFCAGADLGDLAAADSEMFRKIYDAFLRVASSTLPTIAAVNGPAVGAGMNLALACDVRLAARSARFITRFVQIGLHPGGGGAWMLQRLVQSQVAKAMLIFGDELDGEQAAQAGLVLRCVDDDLLVTEAMLLAARGAEVPRELAMRVKQTLNEVSHLDGLSDAVAVELEAQIWSSQQQFFRDRVRRPQSADPQVSQG